VDKSRTNCLTFDQMPDKLADQRALGMDEESCHSEDKREKIERQRHAKRLRTEQGVQPTDTEVETSPNALLTRPALDSPRHRTGVVEALGLPFSEDKKLNPQERNVSGERVEMGVRLPCNGNPESSTSSIVVSSPVATSSKSFSDGSGSESLHGSTGDSNRPSSMTPGSPHVPPKSRTMFHLREKYTGELEYMLREFRKLERQLLGANRASQIEESRGSRERREKLHSFILHLEDTIRQIELGCKLEAEGKSTVMLGVASTNGSALQTAAAESGSKGGSDDSFTNCIQRGKEEEENVQKVEEYILANLLPVKVRLKKQLAAQQGATRNPAGMPTPRRGMLQPSTAMDRGKGTFAAAAEQRLRQAAEEARFAAQQRDGISNSSQFGSPLGGGGSSLTQKLHGATLGSKTRTHGDGVGTSAKNSPSEGTSRKVLYGGMVPGSTQQHSGVAAASGVHEMVIKDSQFVHTNEETQKTEQSESGLLPHVMVADAPENPDIAGNARVVASTLTKVSSFVDQGASLASTPSVSEKQSVGDSVLWDEERKKLRKRRRKKKLLRIARRRERERRRHLVLHQQAVQAAQLPSNAGSGRKKCLIGKPQGKKNGPRSVEYICALCSEAYSSTCDYNPWWALAQHDCPKCRKTQVRYLAHLQFHCRRWSSHFFQDPTIRFRLRFLV
jgi:hypothetical protein